ncbi:MAG: phage BR0599 family protein [Pseudomonadota bacterium]
MSTTRDIWNYFFKEPIVELYKFTCGTTTYTYIATAGETYTYDELIYYPEYIYRTSLSFSADFAKDTITLTIPANNDVAAMFLVSRPEFALQLEIYQGTFHSGNFISVWQGFVTGAGFTYSGSDYSCELSCETKISRMERLGLIRCYQLSCPHTLYSTACGASLTGATTTATVTSVSGTKVTFKSTPSNIAHYVMGQIVKADGSRRLITSYDTSSITMERAFSLEVGDSVTLYKGCDKTTSTCQSRFNNILNYGGFPFMPDIDPFTSVIS